MKIKNGAGSKGGTLILLLFILLFGGALRFYGLQTQSFWNDELASWEISQYSTLTDVIQKGVCPDVHPPGYQILLFFIEQYIGDSEAMLRFPSAVAGVFSIWLIFLLGKTLYSRREALIAAGLMAVSWCPIFYSQEARSYSLLLLFTQITTFLWISLLRNFQDEEKKWKPLLLAGYIISAIIICYLHYFGLFVIALHGLGLFVVCLKQKKNLFPIGLLYLPVFLAYIPWLPTMFEHLSKGPIWIVRPKFYHLTDYFNFCFNHTTYIILILSVFYLLFFISRVKKCASSEERKTMFTFSNPTFLLLLWFIIPVATVYIKSLVSVPIMTNRNLIISLPPLYLLLARSIAALPLKQRTLHFIAVGVVAIIFIDLIFVKRYYSTPEKEQIRDAVEYIVKNDPDRSVIIGYAYNPKFFNYYFCKLNSCRRIDFSGGEEKDIEYITEVLKTNSSQYIWFITEHREPEEKFVAYLKNKYHLRAYKEYIGAKIWLFECKNPKPQSPCL